MIENGLYTKPILFFDGVCNLCNNSVQWIIKKDKQAIFLFAPLQGETATNILGNNALKKYNGVVLFSNNSIYTKSTAALHVVKALHWPYKLLFACIVIPSFLRNWVYNFIGRNRYKWFGKQNTCMMPSAALSKRFLP